MTFHIVLSRPTDLAAVTAGARAGDNPRHSMAELATRLGATVHDGSGLEPSRADRLIGTVTRTRPLWWAIARRLRQALAPGDVVFCTGEDIGIPVARLCGGNGRARVAIAVHAADSLKKKVALRAFGIRERAALFFAVSRPQARSLARSMGDDGRVRFIFDQTDTSFFSPGPAAGERSRPLIASVGLEQRDYATLAAAAEELDVDVRISGFSADARTLARAFPGVMPANMERRFYPWPELVQLYRDADLVLVSLHPNTYAAGVQALMEALACGRPVVVTTTEGLEGYLDRPDALRAVPPGDPVALRATIIGLLESPAERARLSERAAALAQERHSLERYVDEVAAALRRLAAEKTA
jgi:glycosyltransferase involved in cell wall biosynthesis